MPPGMLDAENRSVALAGEHHAAGMIENAAFLLSDED